MTATLVEAPSISLSLLQEVREKTLSFLTDNGRNQLRIQDWGRALNSIQTAIRTASETGQQDKLWELTQQQLRSTP